MLRHVKIWSKQGEEIATFNGDYEPSKNSIQSLINDINRLDGTAIHYGQTLVVTLPEVKNERLIEKLQKVFEEFTQIFHTSINI